MKAADFTSSVPSLSGLLRNLHRANSSELGFIPMGKDTLTGLFSHHEDHPVILALTRDDQLAGYAYWWNNIAEDYQTIIQLVVADPFRLMGLGRRLVEAVEIMGNCRQTRCRVRRDLPANNFWLRMGFTNRAIITHDTSSNLLNSFQRVSHIQEFACNTK
jgi:GNAT superfamily N-acetyltransferase